MGDFDEYYSEELSRLSGLPQRVVNDYMVLACLSSRPDKEVYVLRGNSTNHQFIMKRCPQSNSDALISEYGTLMSLEHPHIPKAVDLFIEDGYAYLIRQYFDGTSLYDLIESAGPMNQDEATRLILSLCGIVRYMHNLSPPLINRDIKPQNIIVLKDGGAALVDFDASRRYSPDNSSDTVCMGSPSTAAPEQFGYVQTDRRTDIYSIGIVLIYSLTGSLDPSAAYSMPSPLRDIAAKCTEFAPKDRYGSIEALRAALLPKTLRPSVKIAAAVCVMAVCFAAGWLAASVYVRNNFPDNVQVYQHEPVSENYVSFKYPIFEEAARIYLGISDDRALTKDDLKAVSCIKIIGNIALPPSYDYDYSNVNGTYMIANEMTERGVISDLSDLSYFPNLKELALIFNSIGDASELKGMNLDTLKLCDNFITDISFLSEIQVSDLFDISSNPVRDLSPVVSLNGIRHISATNCYIADYTPLSELKTLRGVDITSNAVIDLSFLSSLPFLEHINVETPSDKNMDTIYSISGLKGLRISEYNGIDLLRFSDLSMLEYLDLHRCGITDVSFLADLNHLRELYLDDNPIYDISPLCKLGYLERLNLCNVPADLSPVKEMDSLKILTLNQGQAHYAQELGDVQFEIQY